MQVNAILFDVQSIQKYIFANNKLKANVGASYIVDTLFRQVLCESVLLKHIKNDNVSVDIDSWEDGLDITQSLPASVYVASIGGGNALVLVDPTIDCQDKKVITNKIIELFTTEVLVKYPGLKVGATDGELDTNDGQFQKDLGKLYKKLKTNQFNLNPIVRPANTGLTVICDYSGDVGEFTQRFEEGERIVSQSFIAKYEMYKDAEKRLEDMLLQNIEQNFVFPAKLDELGQKKSTDRSKTGINDIAIVHIDGNNMGAKFRECKTSAERSNLSKRVNAHTINSFKKLVEWIAGKYDVLKDQEKFEFKSDNLLPIRPIIVGGDDITFVCNACIAVQSAHYLMKQLLEGEDKIYSCAGIAIIPTSYPFFRGYEMAEQLCDNAKSRMRKYNKAHETDNLKIESCWLDFAFLHGETAPSLEQFLENEYSSVEGNMHFGPYRVFGNNDTVSATDIFALDKVLECTSQFNLVKNNDYFGDLLAHNKVKELRSVLQDNKHSQKLFREQLDKTKKSLPKIAGWDDFAKNLWVEIKAKGIINEKGEWKTPYVDAIELMDYIVPGLE